MLSMKAFWRLKLMFTSVCSRSVPTYVEVQNCLRRPDLTELCCHEAADQSSSCSFSLVSPYVYFWRKLGDMVVTQSGAIWNLKCVIFVWGFLREKNVFKVMEPQTILKYFNIVALSLLVFHLASEECHRACQSQHKSRSFISNCHCHTKEDWLLQESTIVSVLKKTKQANNKQKILRENFKLSFNGYKRWVFWTRSPIGFSQIWPPK